jgi:hypothetical protein
MKKKLIEMLPEDYKMQPEHLEMLTYVNVMLREVLSMLRDCKVYPKKYLWKLR